MKIVTQKLDKGLVVVVPEHLDDLWQRRLNEEVSARKKLENTGIPTYGRRRKKLIQLRTNTLSSGEGKLDLAPNRQIVVRVHTDFGELEMQV